MSERQEKLGRYDHAAIEAKWQRYWEERGTFKTFNPDEGPLPRPLPEKERRNSPAAKPKYYILDMFPYPSGAGLHVGHPVGYCATDIVTRYKRMGGFNVLHPMGFDAFGLPAEQYAVETNVHPAITTAKNIEMYRRQLKMFGFSYDWDREISTSDAAYYKHTQWMFKQMFESWYDEQFEWVDSDGKQMRGKARPIRDLFEELEAGRWGVDAKLRVVRDQGIKGSRDRGTARDGGMKVRRDEAGDQSSPMQSESRSRAWKELPDKEQRQVIDNYRLAYIDEIPVNWCPALGTVLANEEVDNEGRSERGGHPVFRRPLRQWILRISAYAERLLSDLDELDWPEPIKLMQRNWIGRSTGAEIVFPLADKWKAEGRATARTPLPPRETGRGEGEDSADGCPTACGGGLTTQWKCLDPSVTKPLSVDHHPHAIKVYTTRPDTLFGATYMVLAPEHLLVEQIATKDQQASVNTYVEAAKRKSDLARTAESKEKTGVFTGAYAINPANGDRIPIWIADYVLMGYGTGAIMAVPGGDERDYEFAQAMNLPIVCVVQPPKEWIEERVSALAEGIEATAAAGFDRVAGEVPELEHAVAEHRERALGLKAKTVETLRKNVGLDRLVEHFVKHPESWGAAYPGEGVAVHSPGANVVNVPSGVCELNGLQTPAAKTKIIAWLEETGVGRAAVNYKLRDWLFSRQRYWGEPFPVLHGEDGEIIAVDDNELPVELPEMEDFRPTASHESAESLPEPPLARAKHWINVTRNGKRYRRDVNTMPQWAGSCWYYLRFIDPHDAERFADPAAERYWMPIDLYVGGAEHAVLHLLYARFWHKVLFDLGHLSTREPFRKLFNQGMIQSFAFRDSRGLIVGPDKVEERGEDKFFKREGGEPVTRIVAKMSKALKNVVNPDEIIAEYGADTFRMYEMFMGPLDSSKPWNTRDVPGLYKLCQRIWRLFIDEQTGALSPALSDAALDEAALRVLHKTIKRVTDDIESLKFNTAIAAIFDFVNAMTPLATRPRQVLEQFILLVSPFAPHLAEEIWSRLGHGESLAYESWPELNEKYARDDEVEVAVQIKGKVKARIMVPADADEKHIEQAALADAGVVSALAGQTVRKVIVVKGRLVNIVT
jgi:leucyl-tRNA synthetase